MAPKEVYTRADVRRQFGLSERQLRNWEERKLIAASQTYSFADLIAIQTILKLRENHIQPRQIGKAVEALRRKLDWIKHPLSELRIISDGRKIAVVVAGQRMEALTGQTLFDFEASEVGGLRSFPERKRPVNLLRESELWFQRGLELEETGAPIETAIEAYERVLQLNPSAAGALVNLGTIFYRQRKFSEAEKYYLQAVEVDETYPLAQFNLANLYDELGRIGEALEHYRRSLDLNPQYADAHFNLALLCERTGDNLRAVHHWKSYLKLDNASQWAEMARRQLDRLRQATLIHSR